MKGSLSSGDVKVWTLHYAWFISRGYYENLTLSIVLPFISCLFLCLLVSNERAWLGFLGHLK